MENSFRSSFADLRIATVKAACAASLSPFATATSKGIFHKNTAARKVSRLTKAVTEFLIRNETTFALSNGYIGTRGTFDEGYPFTVDEGLEGNFINGFYESANVVSFL